MLLGRASLQALSVETCTRAGMTTGLATFTTTHGVIDRVHNDTTVVWATAEPTRAAGFTAAFESVVGVTDNADSSAASEKHLASFS